jgi:hypothetical protein
MVIYHNFMTLGNFLCYIPENEILLFLLRRFLVVE